MTAMVWKTATAAPASGDDSLAARLATLTPITLDELGLGNLQDRIDTKFRFCTSGNNIICFLRKRRLLIESRGDLRPIPLKNSKKLEGYFSAENQNILNSTQHSVCKHTSGPVGRDR